MTHLYTQNLYVFSLEGDYCGGALGVQTSKSAEEVCSELNGLLDAEKKEREPISREYWRKYHDYQKEPNLYRYPGSPPPDLDRLDGSRLYVEKPEKISLERVMGHWFLKMKFTVLVNPDEGKVGWNQIVFMEKHEG